MSLIGPPLLTCAVQKVGSYPGQTCRRANVAAKTACHPEPNSMSCAAAEIQRSAETGSARNFQPMEAPYRPRNSGAAVATPLFRKSEWPHILFRPN